MIKKVPSLSILALLSFLTLLMMASRSGSFPAQDSVSATPTYNPLVEPSVPENPSDHELGRNWYWHHCMPCHGDKGQGLTDEWRAVWEPDHQNCWGRGCHSGKRVEDSFAIPTIVPPIVSSLKLARFTSYQELQGYLETTHPPQSPGCLTDEQYRTIALYLFRENDRPLIVSTLTLAITPTHTNTPLPELTPARALAPQSDPLVYVSLIVLLLIGIVMLWGIRKIR